jgi:hypothetical protein
MVKVEELVENYVAVWNESNVDGGVLCSEK